MHTDNEKYENVAGLFDRIALAKTSLLMLEEQNGWFTDDDILDAAMKWHLDQTDEDGDFIADDPADYRFIVDSLFDWVTTDMFIADTEGD